MVSEEKKKKVQELYVKGYTYRQIAKELRMSIRDIANCIKGKETISEEKKNELEERINIIGKKIDEFEEKINWLEENMNALIRFLRFKCPKCGEEGYLNFSIKCGSCGETYWYGKTKPKYEEIDVADLFS